MEKFKEYVKEHKLIILIAFWVVFIVSLPLMQNGLFPGGDNAYHLGRIEGIYTSLQNGEFPAKIYSNLANGYGYGSGLFYPDLFLYIPATLMCLGLSLLMSYKIFIALMLLFMFFINYISIKNITDDKNSALIGTILIMLSSCMVLHLHIRVALGEFLAYIFIAPTISGLYDYVHKGFKKPYLLLIGFWGIVSSHLITTLIITIFSIIYFVINIKSTIKDIRKFGKLIVVAFIVFLLSSAFWIPFVEQYFSQKINFMFPWANILDDEYNFMILFGISNTNLGYVLVMCVFFVIYCMFDKKYERKYKIFGILALSITFLSTLDFFWEVTKGFLNILQFKFRLLSLITVLIAITTVCFYKIWIKDKNINQNYIVIAILMISTVCTITYLPKEKYSDEEVYEDMHSGFMEVGGGQEYFPVETKFENLTDSNYVIAESEEKIHIEHFGTMGVFKAEKADVHRYLVPKVYYKGYSATIFTENGENIKLVVHKGKDGLVQVYNPEGLTGTITVMYSGTYWQKVSIILPALTVCLILVYCYEKYKNNIERRKENER